MAVKDYSDKFKADAVALHESTPEAIRRALPNAEQVSDAGVHGGTCTTKPWQGSAPMGAVAVGDLHGLHVRIAPGIRLGEAELLAVLF